MSASPEPDFIPLEPVAGAVAGVSVVDDRHREIENRFSGTISLAAETREEVALALLSRAVGYMALLLGYGVVAHLILG